MPDTTATWVVHDEDGAVLETYQPDAEGTATMAWPEAAKHLTSVSKIGNVWRLNTWLDVPAGDVGVWSNVESGFDAGCSCQDVSFDSDALIDSYAQYNLRLQTVDFASEPDLGLVGGTDTVSVCFDAGADTSVVNLMLYPENISADAVAATLTVTNGVVSYALSPELFENNNQIGEALTISSNASDITHYWVYANSAYGRIWNQRRLDKNFVFPGLNDSNMVQGYRSSTTTKPNGDQLTYRAIRRVKVDQADQVQVLIAENEVTLVSEIEALATKVLNDESAAYDFSGFGTNRASVYVSALGDNFKWQIDGALQGTIPNLSLPADIETALELDAVSVDSLQIGVNGYGQEGGIAAFREQRRLETRSADKQRPAYFDNYDEEHVFIRLGQ